MYNLAYVPKCGTSLALEVMDCFKHTTDYIPDNTLLLLRDPFDRMIIEQIHKLDTAEDFDEAYPDILFEELLCQIHGKLARAIKTYQILDITSP